MMEKTKAVRKFTERNPMGKRSKGRPKNRRKDEVLKDLKTLKVESWTYLVTDRTAWCEVVQKTEIAANFP